MELCWPVADQSTRSVCIIGCGAVTPLGLNAPMTASSVRADLSLFKESYMIDKVGEPMLLSIAGFIEDDVRGVKRMLSLGLPAAIEAIAPVTNGHTDRAASMRIGLCLGLALPRPGLDQGIEKLLLAQLEQELGISFLKTHEFTIPAGHASGLLGITQAAKWISSGEVDLAIVGGVDSYYEPDTLEWLDDEKRLHSEANKDGFIPGEGAGFCLLASHDYAIREQIKPLASIISSAVSEEPYPMISDGVCIGNGLTKVLKGALAVSSADKVVADWTICDMNGESFRAKEWIFAYLRTGKKHRDPLELWHPSDCYGDIGAASGPVLAVIAVASWQRNYARGDRALLWTSSEGGARSATLLQRAN